LANLEAGHDHLARIAIKPRGPLPLGFDTLNRGHDGLDATQFIGREGALSGLDIGGRADLPAQDAN